MLTARDSTTVPVAPGLGPPARSPATIAAARERAAPSSNIALAARRFGDSFPPLRRQWNIRAVSVLLMALMLFYLTWMFGHLAPNRPWLAWPFAAASLFSALCLAVSVINGWSSRVTPARRLDGRDVPDVAVLIPTWGSRCRWSCAPSSA